MARVNRIDLLQAMEAVEPGLSQRPTLEQSDCIIARNGYFFTLQNEIFCKSKSPLDKGIQFAINGQKILAAIRGIPDLEIDVNVDKEFQVKGKKFGAAVQVAEQIMLPIDQVEKPEHWNDLPADFSDALKLTVECSEKGETLTPVTCLHIHPKWIEATDRFTFARYNMLTGVSEPCLVHSLAARAIQSRHPTRICSTKEWLHFRNDSGIRLSVRRHISEYPEMSHYTKQRGKPFSFPKVAADAIKFLELFSKQNTDDNEIEVKLEENRVRIDGYGVASRANYHSKARYSGKPLGFRIRPATLQNLIKEHEVIELVTTDEGTSTLVVSSGPYFFMAVTDELRGKKQ